MGSGFLTVIVILAIIEVPSVDLASITISPAAIDSRTPLSDISPN